MPRKVFHGRRGGRPRNAQAGRLDVNRLAKELAADKAARDAGDGQYEKSERLIVSDRKTVSLPVKGEEVARVVEPGRSAA